MREKWIMWCDLNVEQEKLKSIFGEDCVSIQGSTPNEKKLEYLKAWENEDIPVLITKAKIFGFGLNFQHCNNMVFVGLSDSFEAYYQAVRRCWRFGQKKPVNVHIVISENEGNVLANIKEKEAKADQMLKQMIRCMGDLSRQEINNSRKETIKYKPIKNMEIPEWLSIKNQETTGHCTRAIA